VNITGCIVDSSTQNVIFQEALYMFGDGVNETVSINDFRKVINEYIDAVETGNEGEWRRLRGV